MIKPDKFVDYIMAYQRGTDFLRNMDDAGLDLYETPLCASADTLLDAWLDQVLNEEGQDLVYWWLFEDVDKVITDNDNEFNVEDIEEFTKYLLNNGYFKTEENS
jgi:hypothetical protein